MRAALALARRGLGNTWPNPAVGCVIVRDGRVIGRGVTAPGGRPHAEAAALAMAGEAARGATAYVTLEPCSHHGQTPPCAHALIAAGVARVVVALGDPDARVNGQGIAKLLTAGVAVETGLLADEAAEVNAGFLTRVGTVMADNPELTCRIEGFKPVPTVRVVADSHLRTRLTARLLATALQSPTWFLCRDGAEAERRDAMRGAGAEVIEVASGDAGVDLAAGLRALGGRGITRVLVEGGAQIAAALLRADLVDGVAWFHAPAVMGGDGWPSAQAFGVQALAAMPRFERVSARVVGEDILSEYRRLSRSPA